MSRNRVRVFEVVENCFSENEKTSPEYFLFSYGGILCPAALSSPETLAALKSFETRSNNVILASCPKTGTNWLEQMVREMEAKDAKYTEEEMKERKSALKKLQMFPHIEFGDPGVLENPVLGMKMVTAFSGFSLREAEFYRIAKMTNFQPTKEKFKENHGKFGDILFSEGAVGSWRDFFSEAQNEAMNQKIEECTGGTILATKIKYSVHYKT